MLEQVQCIVISKQGSLGLLQVGKGFSMLRTLVEFDETPTEAAHRILRVALGNAVDFKCIEQLNLLSDAPESVQFTFVLRVDESATNITRARGFQWLNPRYRETLEVRHPKILGDGVASTYRRAMSLKKIV